MKIAEGWLVFSTLGEMATNNIVEECQKDGWVPILVFRGEDGDSVPVLDTQEKAIRFAQRNLPKNQLFGTVMLTEEDGVKLESELESKGIRKEFLDHPKKMRGKADVEIYEFVGKPDIYGIKKNMVTTAISYDIKNIA